MMGKEYFTVAGYVSDGGVLCRECGERQALLVEDQITEAQAYSDFPEGLSCDSCFAEIVPPEEVEEPEVEDEDESEEL